MASTRPATSASSTTQAAMSRQKAEGGTLAGGSDVRRAMQQQGAGEGWRSCEGRQASGWHRRVPREQQQGVARTVPLLRCGCGYVRETGMGRTCGCGTRLMATCSMDLDEPGFVGFSCEIITFRVPLDTRGGNLKPAPDPPRIGPLNPQTRGAKTIPAPTPAGSETRGF